MTAIEKLQLAQEPQLQQQVNQVLATAEEHDGVAAFSEQFLLGLSDASLNHTHWGYLQDDQVVGLWAGDGATAELVVHPQYRRQGIATALLATQPSVPVWAHGNIAPAQYLAQQLGWQSRRELLVMQTALPLPAAPDLVLPAGYEIWDLPKAQAQLPDVTQRWLAINNEAFDWHPEQGGWDAARLQRAQQVDWFRAEDVLFLVDVADKTAPQLAGFHWLKRHGELAAGAHGEVYVVGLASNYQGKGLGKVLTLAGLQHLAEAGAQVVDLYVERDNEAAVATYTSLGFAVVESHVLYAQ